MSAIIQVLLSALFVTTWILCASAPGDGHAAAAEPCPAGFEVHYEWRAGTVPPPYHYEYSIDIRESGEGTVHYVPDYPSEKAPVWTESFAVDSKSLSQLCGTMASNGLWTQNWQPSGVPLLGGSSESVTVKSKLGTVTIPSLTAGRQKAQAKAICEAIKSLVPQSIWTKMEAERQQYREDQAGQ